ncbi:MAG: CinA family protein, partial [Pseudomonadota bacterium]|nr:CinA family protein [Pseudomonadota bacterium]
MVTSGGNWGQLIKHANALAEQLNQRQQTLATAESCTGGGIGYLLTEIAGSSNWFNGGLITYTNALKQSL